jgi:hypothetical protein
MVLCSSCDGVPLTFKKKNGQASSFEDGLIERILTPLKICWTIQSFKILFLTYGSALKGRQTDAGGHKDGQSLAMLTSWAYGQPYL